MASNAVKEAAKQTAAKIKFPPSHGIKITKSSKKMRQYGHIQGNSILEGYHPKQDELLNLFKNDKTYLYGVSKLSLHWNCKGKGNTGARYFKYDKVPPLTFWNPDVQFQITKQYAGKPSLKIEMTNGTTKEISVEDKNAEDIMKALVESVNSVSPNKDFAHAQAFAKHWASRALELHNAEKENVEVAPETTPETNPTPA